ncbi:galactosyltransferase-related protein [Agrobacterium tumefaciens]|uniref:galactosyltransferase-related protein n=1 Tax=Agrobacterium tumefaciens TaxID=358 RepID=UPI00224435B9|nr:galactosyltransferase-related protein [Agrobacterium tumefaciens]MCW8060088.1 galactosyltransferase-related protein [Agrobacterium tumefaciens]
MIDVIIPSMSKPSTEVVCAYYLSLDLTRLGKIVVVDLSPEIELGAVKLAARFSQLAHLPIHGMQHFNKSFALNVGASISRAELMLFCDADVMIPQSTLALLKEKTVQGSAFYVEYVYETETGHQRGGPGIICLHRADFIRVGGYDSALSGWGYEDRDFIERLLKCGCDVKPIGSAFHISHTDNQRTANYAEKVRELSRKANAARSAARIAAGMTGTFQEDIATFETKLRGVRYERMLE